MAFYPERRNNVSVPTRNITKKFIFSSRGQAVEND